MRWIGAALLAACGTSGSGLSATVIVTSNGRPAAGVTVLSHRDDGGSLDRQVADATGRAVIATEVGGLATAIFPATIEPSTLAITAITAQLPATGELAIDGPAAPRAPAVVGALAITAPALAGVDGYEVDLGCALIRVATMPSTVDVAAACLGSDANLDVLVTGVKSLGADVPDQVVAYAAARVPLDGGAAAFDISAWITDGAAIPVTLAGVTPSIEVTVTTDGLTFPTLPVTDHATLWTGLAVDSSTVTAATGFTMLGEITTRTRTGSPAAIAFGPDDFLPELDSVVLLDDRATLAIRWSPPSFVVDALDVHVEWQPALRQLIWDAELPPDTDHVRFPDLDPDLAALVELPSSPTIDIASDFRAIVTRPDEQLTSHSAGFR